MKETEQIKSELQKFAEQFGPAAIVPATVLSISDDDTIKVQLSDDTVLEDVRLRSVVKSGNKIVFVPKAASIVLIGRIENSSEYVVIAVEEIDKLIAVIGTTHFEVSANGFLIKRGNYTLKQVIQNTIESTQQIVVIYGNNPDYTKLATALTQLNNILL